MRGAVSARTARVVPDDLLILSCGLCRGHVHFAFPPMSAPGVIDGERLGLVMLMHVRHGCPGAT